MRWWRIVGGAPTIAELSTTTHHNDVAVYAIDANPATGSGLGAKFDHVVSGFSSHCNYGPCYEPMGPR